MNQIVSQYIEVVSEQQRALHSIIRDITEINRRLTNVVNRYSNSDSLRTIVPGTNENIRNLVPSVPEISNSNIEDSDDSNNNTNTDEDGIEYGNDGDDESNEGSGLAGTVDEPSLLSSPMPYEQNNSVSENTDIEDIAEQVPRDRTNSFHENNFNRRRPVFRHRRSSMALIAPTTTATNQSNQSSNSSLRRPPPTRPPPPPPPQETTHSNRRNLAPRVTTRSTPVLPPVLNISTRSMSRNNSEYPLSNNWLRELASERNVNASNAMTPLLPSQRVFRFSLDMNNTGENTISNDLSPVRIRPTRSQVRRGTELLTWCDVSNNFITQCPIDLAPFQEGDSILRIRHCGHIFREMNLRRHFRRNSRCPLCRYDIRDYIPNSNTPSITENDLESGIANIVEETVNQLINGVQSTDSTPART
jgi:hypothetical protein